MDFKQKLLEEMNRKRKKVAEVEKKDGGAKFFKRGDLEAQREAEYIAKKTEKEKQKEKLIESLKTDAISMKSALVEREVDERTPMEDVRRKLRARGHPILLFGETEKDVRKRLRALELEQPDMKEGWSNELQTAMKDINTQIDKDIVEGNAESTSKHDVALPSGYDGNWAKIEHDSKMLTVGDDMKRECDIILSIIRYLLARWGKDLNDRPIEVKKTAQGMLEAAHHKQTTMHLKSLTNSLETYNVNNDIRHHLAKICRLLVIDRNYLEANNAYMEMAIGNAPWPVGVTRSGIHQRPGSAKAYVSNIAHVLNDETQRKYIQAFKRLMTKMQEYFPTDPSKCVEFVKKPAQS
ncbi:unnamed protein product [Caenorhabditis bovis]|uniref:Pre-mRNA-splicing factor 18 n=1 Tax=Caenorhabditis bovis TaxID=2654633 RepID=A0A8S1EZ45_9PELO|nr:unnamed protein product [Caenorhabditis bovis]